MTKAKRSEKLKPFPMKFNPEDVKMAINDLASEEQREYHKRMKKVRAEKARAEKAKK